MKTSDTERYRGFESHPLRHVGTSCARSVFFLHHKIKRPLHFSMACYHFFGPPHHPRSPPPNRPSSCKSNSPMVRRISPAFASLSSGFSSRKLICSVLPASMPTQQYPFPPAFRRHSPASWGKTQVLLLTKQGRSAPARPASRYVFSPHGLSGHPSCPESSSVNRKICGASLSRSFSVMRV